MKRVLITAPASGSGKTTVTCALLAAFASRGMDVASFKCGPDYIDPMFHEKTAGINAYNLDPFFLDRAALREQFALRAGRDISVIEGAMGYYDGIAMTTDASCYTVARATETPAILVFDARKSGNSIAAVMAGFKAYRPDSGIEGVIFNGITAARYPDMERLAREAGLIPLGYLPFDGTAVVESRHLGLVTPDEVGDIRQKLQKLGKTAEETIDIDGVIKLAGTAPPIEKPAQIHAAESPRVRVAVARDRALFFLYKETIARFERFGGEIVYFSPLCDDRLPPDINALYLPGGYPELYAAELSKRAAMLEDIRNAVASGLPTIAEGGGFMLLHDTLDGYPMAGAIAGAVQKTDRLQRFGYMTMTAGEDNLLCPAGGEIRAHECHYWASNIPGGAFSAKKAGRGEKYNCALATETLYAGFPHLYIDDKTAKRFIEKAEVGIFAE